MGYATTPLSAQRPCKGFDALAAFNHPGECPLVAESVTSALGRPTASCHRAQVSSGVMRLRRRHGLLDRGEVVSHVS